MAKIRMVEGGKIAFDCPGCGEVHCVSATTPILSPQQMGQLPPQRRPSGWQWNGNVEKPTIVPSIRCSSGHFAQGFKVGDRCWCTYDREHPGDPSGFKCHQCHLILTDGQIMFCADSTHELKGKTVPLPDWGTQ